MADGPEGARELVEVDVGRLLADLHRALVLGERRARVVVGQERELAALRVHDHHLGVAHVLQKQTPAGHANHRGGGATADVHPVATHSLILRHGARESQELRLEDSFRVGERTAGGHGVAGDLSRARAVLSVAIEDSQETRASQEGVLVGLLRVATDVRDASRGEDVVHVDC